MSALAKFTMITSNAVSFTAFTTASAIPAADISGARSYVATFCDGTSTRSSPPNGFSMPPLKKYVTCAYFSVSATRRLRRLACAIRCASRLSIDSGGITMGSLKFLSYCVMQT